MQSTSFQNYRAALSQVTLLTIDEEKQLAQAWARGDQAAGHRIIEASLPFVVSIARKYRRWGVPIEDLVQQGNLGLLKAAAKFDPDKDCRLMTYASYWIRAEIRDYVVRSYRIVRLGTTRTERRAMRAYRTSDIDSAEALAAESGMPAARAQKLWPLLSRGDVSLDAKLTTEAPTRLERMENGAPTPEESFADSQMRTQVRDSLEKAFTALTEREQRIVRRRILSEQPDTLAALGEELGVSKERVRQLEVRAREKLRSRLEHLRDAA